VNSSLSLNQLQILPSAGTLQIISPFNASAFVQVFDSLGGFDQQFNSADDGVASSGAATGLAYATATASAVSLTALTTAGVNIPNQTISAGTVPGSPYGLLQGSFEIVGAPGPVSVQFIAALSVAQSLFTSQDGRSATSEATFSLLLPDISSSPILFYDDLLTIGPSAGVATSASPLLAETVTLETDTPYFLIVDTDPEVKGDSMTPEPAYLPVLIVGTLALFSLRARKLVKARST
jgi:hypothetical protein